MTSDPVAGTKKISVQHIRDILERFPNHLTKPTSTLADIMYNAGQQDVVRAIAECLDMAEQGLVQQKYFAEGKSTRRTI